MDNMAALSHHKLSDGSKSEMVKDTGIEIHKKYNIYRNEINLIKM